jgi:hypothetical protein
VGSHQEKIFKEGRNSSIKAISTSDYGKPIKRIMSSNKGIILSRREEVS